MASRRLQVIITGDSRGAKKAFGEAEKSAGGFRSKLASVSKSAIGFGTKMSLGFTLPIVAGLSVAVKAAAEEDKAIQLLSATLRKNTDATKSQVDAVEEWVTKTQNATGVMDDELRPAFQKLIIAGRSVEQTQSDLAVALDISAARGKPLATIIEAMSKAAKGNVGALGRLGIATKDAAGNTLSYEEILKEAARTMGGQAAEAADTAAGKTAILNAKFEDLKETIGEELLPVLTDLVDGLSGVIDKFSELTPTQQKLLVFGLVALAAIGPVTTAFGGLAAAIGFLFTPVGALIVAGVALAAGLVYLYKTNEQFRESVDGVTESLLTVGTWIKTHWPEIQTVFGTVMQYLSNVTNVVLGAIRGYWHLFGENITDNIRRVFGIIQGIFGVAMNIIRGIVHVATSVIRGDWSGAWDAILTTTQRVWSGVIGVVRNAIGVVRNLVSGLAGILSGIAGAARAAWNNTIGGKGIHIPGFDPPGPGPSFKGFDFEIPRFHSGGVFRAPSGRSEGLALLKDRERVLTPGQSIGAVTNVFHITETKSARDTAAQVAAILQNERAMAGATASAE